MYISILELQSEIKKSLILYKCADLTYIRSPFHREVSEWLKEHAWKVCKRESVSRVRIPSSLHFKFSAIYFLVKCI